VNRPIRTLAIGCLLLFIALLINVNFVSVIRAGELNSQADNKRVRDEECSRERGPILVGGDAVARSVKSHDDLEYIRRYSEPKLYAPVTGFFSCTYGTSGIEQTQNAILSGSDSRLFVNRVIDMVGNEQPKGGSVLLTLDPEVQIAAAKGLAALPGDTAGAAVALDPETGAILAMVSTPSYDPNLLATHDQEELAANYARLSNSPDKVMRNRATQERYPPGSTFKLVTAAAALSNGYSPDSLVKGDAVLDLPQTSRDLHNENGSSCGGSEITLTRALEVSCNVAFGDLGLKLGQDTLRDQAEMFGFNEDIIDELPASADSVFPENLDEPQLAFSAIGQYEVAATPLQMAMVAAGIANGGDVMRPYVVQAVRSPDVEILDEADPEVLHQAVSGGVADDLTQMMVGVVENGTGSNVQIPGVDVAGKTGTANSAQDRSPYAWMVTFAPADDAEVAVAVFIESTAVERGEVSGNGLAGPIAKSIMEAVINQ